MNLLEHSNRLLGLARDTSAFVLVWVMNPLQTSILRSPTHQIVSTYTGEEANFVSVT